MAVTVVYESTVQNQYWGGSAKTVTVENDSNHVGRICIIQASIRATATFSMSNNTNTWTEVVDGGTNDSMAVYVRQLTASDLNDSIDITPSASANGALTLWILDGLGPYDELAATLKSYTSTSSPSTNSATAPESGGETVIVASQESATTPNAATKSGWSSNSSDGTGDDYYTNSILWLTDGATGSTISYSISTADGVNAVLSFSSPAGPAGGSGSGGSDTDTGYGFGGGVIPNPGAVDATYRRWISDGEMLTVVRVHDGASGALIMTNYDADVTGAGQVGAKFVEMAVGPVDVDPDRAVRSTTSLAISDPVGCGVVPLNAKEDLGTLGGVDIHVLSGFRGTGDSTTVSKWVDVPAMDDSGGNRIDSDESFNLNSLGTVDLIQYFRVNLFDQGWDGDGEYLVGSSNGRFRVRHSSGGIIFQVRLATGTTFSTVQTTGTDLENIFADHTDAGEADRLVFFKVTHDVNVSANRKLEYSFHDTNDPDAVPSWTTLTSTVSADTDTNWYNESVTPGLFHIDQGASAASDGAGEIAYHELRREDTGATLTRFCVEDVTAADVVDTGTHDDAVTGETWTYHIDAAGEMALVTADDYGTKGLDRLFPLGVFVVADCEVLADETGVTYTADLEDRSWRLNRRMGAAVTIATGLNLVTVIESLVLGALPDTEFVSDSSPFTAPAMDIEPDANRLDVILRLAEAGGLEVYFDGEGRCNIRSVTTTDGDALFAYGLDGLPATNLKRGFTNSTAVINGVIMEGASIIEGDVATGTYYDRDPASPGYYDPTGANTQTTLMGPSPEVIQNDYVTADAQALVAAYGRLVRVGNGPERITFEVGPNPALSIGDLVRVTHTDARISGLWEVVKIKHPTTPGRAVLVVRSQWDPTGGTSINE